MVRPLPEREPAGVAAVPSAPAPVEVVQRGRGGGGVVAGEAVPLLGARVHAEGANARVQDGGLIVLFN